MTRKNKTNAELIADRKEYQEKCRSEADRIMKDLSIAEPQCGFYAGLGWMPAVEKALKEMIAAGWDKELHQVKQKFCGLRIYTGASTPEVDEIIAQAEETCYSLCEECGKEREKKGTGMGAALCNKCEDL